MNRHLIFTTALVLTSMIMALITCDLGAVFELIGATSAASLAYIFPPLCYIKLSNSSRKAKVPAYLCIAFGVIVMGCLPERSLLTICFYVIDDGGASTCSA
ncbi:hypothetical protein EYZ11_011718 [Aspergillus tanneri]|uniref:Amino acid transporter transmembrane domain-containing protein n=1 Tax=Aspergillus tanneri TaxID=1220188 RepID=A0A4V3UMW8_9EURO|nr:hypothetical protein EYZ11_011718 [Aspergillus tanneri]